MCKLRETSKSLFAIASNSKLFVAVSIGILVDQGKVKWHDKVKDILPGFEMQDPVASDQVTITDLLCHRWGVPRTDYGPYNSDTIDQVVDKIKFYKPSATFRNTFQYSNRASFKVDLSHY
jgi:CubicO group peptidase (beta-lactamase class C family)